MACVRKQAIHTLDWAHNSIPAARQQNRVGTEVQRIVACRVSQPAEWEFLVLRMKDEAIPSPESHAFASTDPFRVNFYQSK
jgi:hypothetical protein